MAMATKLRSQSVTITANMIYSGLLLTRTHGAAERFPLPKDKRFKNVLKRS